MRKYRQGCSGKHRNPFDGRKILTDSDAVRQICPISRETIRDYSSYSARSKKLYCSSLKGSDAGSSLSNSNQLMSDLQLQNISDYKERLNKNANNDTNPIHANRRKENNCSRADEETGHKMKKVDMNSENNASPLFKQEQATSNIKNGRETYRIQKTVTDIACVRMCSQCLEETKETNENSQFSTDERSASKQKQTWSPSINTNQTTDSETDFLSCLSLGNTTKPSQRCSVSKGADKECVSTECKDTQTRKPIELKTMISSVVPCDASVYTEVKKTEGQESAVCSLCKNIKPQNGAIYGSYPWSSTCESALAESNPERVRLVTECAQQEVYQYLNDQNKAATEGNIEIKSQRCFDAGVNGMKLGFSDESRARSDTSNDYENAWGKSESLHTGNINRPIRLIDHLEKEKSKEKAKCDQRASILSTGRFSLKNYFKSTSRLKDLKYGDLRYKNVSGSERMNQHITCFTSNHPVSEQEHCWHTSNSANSTASSIYSRNRSTNIRNDEKMLSANEDMPQILNRLFKERMGTESVVSPSTGIPDHQYQQHHGTNIAARLFIQNQRKFLSPLVTSRNTASTNTPTSYNMSSNAVNNAEGVYNYRNFGPRDNHGRSDGHSLDLTRPAFLHRNQPLGYGMRLRRKTIPELSVLSQRPMANCKEAARSFWDEKNQHGWHPGACRQCGRHFNSNSCWASIRDKSTQTDMQEIGTNAVEREKTDAAASTSNTVKQHVSWMPRLEREGSRFRDWIHVSKSSPSNKVDCLFKPISSDEEVSSPVFGAETNGLRNFSGSLCRRASTFSSQAPLPDSQVAEEKGYHLSHELSTDTSSKTAVTDRNFVMNRYRRTVSSTTIPAACEGNDAQESLRSCQSLSSLRDRNESSLPHGHSDHHKEQESSGDSGTHSSAAHNIQNGDFKGWSSENFRSAQSKSSISAAAAHEAAPNRLGVIGENWNSSNTNDQEDTKVKTTKPSEVDTAKANNFIGEYLLNLWENQYLCDVAVTVGGKQMMAHKLVLAAFSDAFCPSSPYTRPYVCFDIPDSTPEAVYQIFRYMYTSSMDINDDNMEAALRAALFMGVTEVVDIIKGILKQPDVNNYETYARISETLQIPFDVAITKMARESLTDLADTNFFPKMSFEQLETILDEPNVMVTSEEDTLQTVLKWIENNPSELRRAHVLMQKVVLESIPAAKLGEYMDQYPKIFSDCGVLAIVTKAFRHHALKREAGDIRSLKKDLGRSNPPPPLRERESFNCDEILGPGYKRDPRCDEIKHGSNNANARSSIKPSFLTSDRAHEVGESSKGGGYEGFRRSVNQGKFMSSSLETYEPRTDFTRSCGRSQNNASSETKAKNWADKSRATATDKDHRSFQDGIRTVKGADGGQGFASRSLSDFFSRDILKRSGGEDDDGKCKTESTTRERGRFVESFQNKEGSFSERTGDNTMVPRRLQRLNFLSGSGTPRLRTRKECGFSANSSRNDNHSTGEEAKESPLSEVAPPSTPRRGDGFWYRPIHMSEIPSSRSFREFISPRGLSLSRRNNNTNNSKEKVPGRDEDRLPGRDQSLQVRKNLRGKSQRSFTPFQCERSKTSGKKYQTRKHCSTFRHISVRKSPNAAIFESPLSTKTVRNHKSRKDVKLKVSKLRLPKKAPPENLSSAEQTFSPVDSGEFATDELEHRFLSTDFPSMEEFHGQGNDSSFEKVTPDVDGKPKVQTHDTDSESQNPPIQIQVNTTPRQNKKPEWQSSENSFSLLGHDEETSAFKKFVRWQALDEMQDEEEK